MHLLIETSPATAPATLVNTLKTVSSRLLRRDFKEALSSAYDKPALWSRSYFIASCGGAPLETIKRYIEGQDTPS